METVVILLYVLAALCSIVGAVWPWWSARLMRAKGARALAVKKRLDDAVDAAIESGDDDAHVAASSARVKALREPFEGGPMSLTWWTEPVMFGSGTGASRAAESERDRRAGLDLIAAGVVIGSVASILGLRL